METGRIRPMPFERFFAVVGDLLYGTILTNLMSGRPADPESQARDVADVILNGILADGGDVASSGGGEVMTTSREDRSPTPPPGREGKLTPPLPLAERVGGGVLLSSSFFPPVLRSPRPPPTRARRRPVAVTVAPVKTVSLPRTVPVVGTLHAFDDVQLAPKVDGRVLRIFKDVGDAVVPGEVLLELDPDRLRARGQPGAPGVRGRIAEAQARRAARNRRRVRRRISPKVDAVAQALANLELAQKELARHEVENSQGGRLGTGARHGEDQGEGGRGRRSNWRGRTRGSRWPTPGGSKAALDDAEEKLRETTLRAPTRPEWAAWSAVLGVGREPDALLGRGADGFQGRDDSIDAGRRTRTGSCSTTS